MDDIQANNSDNVEKKLPYGKTKVYIKIISAGVAILIFLTAGVFLGRSLFAAEVEEPVKSALTPLEILETFEISSLSYHYRNVFYEANEEERKFLFIPLEPGVKRYAVMYEGMIKIGVNGENIKLNEQRNGETTILSITIPEAYIISHEAPLNDTLEVLFDEAEHTEKFSIGEYASTLNEKKIEIETGVEQSNLLEEAQEIAKNQLESFLRAIPDIRDNYVLVFELA